ncbi:MAG: rhomboid family intramembrane serine protease, partial [Planctomycetota bacterium]
MNPNFTSVYESPQRKACMEIRLVLDAVGLSAQVSQSNGFWRVLVREDQLGIALQEVSSYQEEKRATLSKRPTQIISMSKGVIESVIAFAFAIIVCSFVGWSSSGGEAFTDAGLVDAGLVQKGEFWRCVTALTLHLDLPHLLSNLVFGALFIVIAGKWLGGGVASL